jgi:hypothetical protein
MWNLIIYFVRNFYISELIFNPFIIRIRKVSICRDLTPECNVLSSLFLLSLFSYTFIKSISSSCTSIILRKIPRHSFAVDASFVFLFLFILSFPLMWIQTTWLCKFRYSVSRTKNSHEQRTNKKNTLFAGCGNNQKTEESGCGLKPEGKTSLLQNFQNFTIRSFDT